MPSRVGDEDAGPAFLSRACMPQEPGNKLLIATSAAEEGIDVPNCEFVVRYNAAASGTQRLQSRGRARVLEGAEFLCLLQVCSLLV